MGENEELVTIACTNVQYSSVLNSVKLQNGTLDLCHVGIRYCLFRTLLGAETPPPRGHPPVAMMFQKVIQHHRKAQGRSGG
jgi:hypothetical protein